MTHASYFFIIGRLNAFVKEAPLLAPFYLSGRVIEGKRLGRSIGFPTANLAYDPHDRPWPREGVYIATAQVEGDDRTYLSILNQGRHPTAPEGLPTVEAFLLDYHGPSLYGKRLHLTYQQFLRPEQKFASLEDLKAQLLRDQQSARDWYTKGDPA